MRISGLCRCRRRFGGCRDPGRAVCAGSWRGIFLVVGFGRFRGWGGRGVGLMLSRVVGLGGGGAG